MPTTGVRSSHSYDADTTERLTSGSMRFLLGAACVVIISAGVKAASDVLSLVLLGFLLAYSALPLLKFVMHQFHLRKTVALAFAVGLVGTLQVVLVVLLGDSAASLKQKLPIYEERSHYLYQHVAIFLQSHGVDITNLLATNLSTSSEIVKFANLILPEAGRLFSDGLVVVLLAGVLLSMIAEDTERTGTRLILTHVQKDVANFIAASATTGILTALVDLVLLVAFGVDFPLVCCVLYFFLNFIPSIGFVLALVTPSCLALLMLGWKKALLVLGSLVLTQLVSEYAISPLLLKRKGVKVSSIEKTLSLLWWVFLFGPVGGILAIPLTLAMKRFVPDLFVSERRSSASASE